MSTLSPAPRPKLAVFFAAIAGAIAAGSASSIKEMRGALQEGGIRTGNRKTSAGKNQRQRRKNARRRWAAGDRAAFRC